MGEYSTLKGLVHNLTGLYMLYFRGIRSLPELYPAERFQARYV